MGILTLFSIYLGCFLFFLLSYFTIQLYIAIVYSILCSLFQYQLFQSCSVDKCFYIIILPLFNFCKRGAIDNYRLFCKISYKLNLVLFSSRLLTFPLLHTLRSFLLVIVFFGPFKSPNRIECNTLMSHFLQNIVVLFHFHSVQLLKM